MCEATIIPYVRALLTPKSLYLSQFQYDVGATTCLDCPAGSTSVEASKECVCAAGRHMTYAYVEGFVASAACEDCPVGFFYMADTSPPTCDKCPAGKFAGIAGSLSCDSCDADTYSEAKASICTSCPLSSSTNSLTEQSITGCICPAGEGMEFTKEGSYSCVSCSAGRFSSSSMHLCEECPLGHHGSGGASCDECAPGTYADATGLVSCYTCGYKKYAESSGSFSCTDCPVDASFDVTISGSTTRNDCKCPAGKANHVPPDKISGNYYCESCPVGKYSTIGSSCTNCEAGYYAESTGSPYCMQCSSDSYAEGTGNR